MPSLPRSCSIENCEKIIIAHSLCHMHYARLRRHGDPLYSIVQREYHGQTRSTMYRRWNHMKRRTSKPNTNQYHDYGGRGIKTCEGWRSSFVKYMNDVGLPPSDRHTLDRIDNDGHYSCGSCNDCTKNGWPMNLRWSTPTQQLYNTRIRKDNTTGYRGVRKDYNRYIARIRYRGKEYILGRFDTPEEAAEAHAKAVKKFHDKDS